MPDEAGTGDEQARRRHRAASPDEEARAKLYPDLYHAAVNGPVAFRHLVQARRLASDADDPDAKPAANWLIPRLSERFAPAPDEIVKEFYCHKAVGGCLLTGKRVVHSILNSPPADLVDAEVTCKVLAREAAYGLQSPKVSRQLEEATDHVYSALTRIMAAADRDADREVEAEVKAKAVTDARSEVKEITTRVQVLLQKQARVEYFKGVLWGFVPAIVVSAVFGAVANRWWESVIVPSALVAATIMAILGATVSVIQRMSTGSLVIDHTASSSQRRLLGALRPAVGAIFGSLAYFTLLTGILAGGDTSGSGAASLAVFALTGFAAGFSERFATDMLERAGQLLEQPTAPSG